MLVGRERELAAAVAVCREAADGRGSVLLVSGEPGIGKTALLDAASGDDPGWRVLRATGVEAESAVAFAALQGLLWPLRDGIDELEAGQARLLRGVLDLGPAGGATSFAVGAATLALLSLASRDEPIVAIVDDAQWADVASQEALSFVGRRAGSERIALLVGVRDGESCLIAEDRGFQRLELGGLGARSARSLVEQSTPNLAPAVGAWLLDLCDGNPLGLIELPLVLNEAQRRGEEPLPTSPEVGPLVQRAFAARAAALDPDARHALLLVAAAGEADFALLSRLEVPAAALDALEQSGLVRRHAGKLEFRHPLVQSAIYGAATPAERRAAHLALADATEGARRAWHLADATAGPDEAAAEALVAVAADARLSGGLAAEAQALERAAELTVDDETRSEQLLAAAQTWRRSGRIEHADQLLDAALRLTHDDRRRARIQLERGSMLVRQHQMDGAYDLLLAEADRVAPIEPKLAALMLVQAETAIELERLDTRAALALAERARSLAGQDGDRAELETINSLVVARMTTGAPPDSEDLALVARAAELLERAELRAGSEEAHWISYCLALHEHDDEARRLSDRCIADARAVGDVWSLCYALTARAALEQATGRIDLARAWASEALPLADQIGEPYRICESYAVMTEVESARGDVDNCRRAHEVSVAHQWAGAPVPAEEGLAFGLAFLARGRFEEAVAHLATAASYLGSVALSRAWYQFIPVELAEAYVGAGRTSDAESVLRGVAAGIESAPLQRPRAKLARVRGLLAPEAKIDAAFSTALDLLEHVPQNLERARVELCWGERLRHAGRSADATTHLEHALAGFEALGAPGWADRTRTELEAATGTTRPAQQRHTDLLTAQELRVASHAAAGMRDREIAALLYLSPRTVESYLQSAYRKLGVSNRTQLAGVLAADGIRPASAHTRPVPQDP